MPGGSLLLLLDDIASVLDDVSVMTKVAAKKTAGVVGDDLALNAQQLTGVRTDRELSVVWAVAKGSALNKAILVPSALAISAFLPRLVIPLLMVGGAFLCFEGVEKLVHKFLHAGEAEHRRSKETPTDAASMRAPDAEREKIAGAIRTDFILSAEIIVIALGTVAAKPFSTQVGVLTTVAVLMTVGVYGLVAGIVKLDDVGLYLSRRYTGVPGAIGRGLVGLAPYLMRFLSIAGTAAMFLVGGGIIVHGLPVVHHWVEAVEHTVETIPAVGRALAWLVVPVGDGVVGVLVGALALLAVLVGKWVAGRVHPSA
ncbi:MAG: DUF808 domain-containing protein [Chloracidobacterium sp.]|nr:DUF808 domain-containing protein [Chloracidobacterium sp.]MDW8216583.1 DUF808 domain-containing protein [Acidobacteriota bacterium]